MNESPQDRSVEIHASSGKRSLRFHNRIGDYFTASIEGVGPCASVCVWGYTDCHLLVDLFEFIARDWRGWPVECTWASIEGEFRIAASASSTGTVTLKVELTNNQEVDQWRLSVPIYTETGQLERIARQVASFFQCNG